MTIDIINLHIMQSRIGIIGATGYTGTVLVRLLNFHDKVEITYLASEQHEGKYFYDVYPAYYPQIKIKCNDFNISKIADSCDLIFFATPNNFAKENIPKFLAQKNTLKIIDLSADFRLDEEIYVDNNQRLKITYGLPEVNRDLIKKSSIIANPGCYPTSIILGLLPALKNKIINPNTIIIDSKSGTSGAGKQPKQELHFCEVNESFTAYNLAGKHRHLGEIENEISKICKCKTTVTFSPHLLPINRGILSTIYAKLSNKHIQENEILELYSNEYKNESFVKVLPKGIYANTKNVKHTNLCHLTVLKDERTEMLIIVSTIDNMIKGASGQAIQNMNLVLDINESYGLDTLGHIP